MPGRKLIWLTLVALLSLCGAVSPAFAQTTPGPSPTVSPLVSPDPSPTSTPSPSVSPSESPSATPSQTPTGDQGGPPSEGPLGGIGDGLFLTPAPPTDQTQARMPRQPPARREKDASWTPDPSWGAYSTEGLVRVAGGLARQGWRPHDIEMRVFAPFPVGGLAAWTDTWGAPRYAGGYHPHHGQDLMCAEGTPLLAVEPGVVQLHSDPLGGTTIFLVRANGSFWYYAHLSRYASGITDGTRVTTGQRIGACGSSGDATVSHLHFALFSALGKARDPMRALVDWLHVAERSSGLRPSTGDFHLPKASTSEAGDEPTQPLPDQAVVSVVPDPLAAMVDAPPSMVVAASEGRVGFLLGAVLLLLPIPLASKRVRTRARRLRSA